MARVTSLTGEHFAATIFENLLLLLLFADKNLAALPLKVNCERDAKQAITLFTRTGSFPAQWAIYDSLRHSPQLRTIS